MSAGTIIWTAFYGMLLMLSSQSCANGQSLPAGNVGVSQVYAPHIGQHNLYASDADAYVRSLMPATNGPGILIGEPVPTTADASMEHFGSACSAWLEMTLAGQGEFGQTPPLPDLSEARWQLALQNLRLYPFQVPVISQILGLGYVATATIESSGSGYKISYQLNKNGSPYERPVILQGTSYEIVAALPSAAKQLNKLIYSKDLPLPGPVGLSTDDMMVIGSILENYFAPVRITPDIASLAKRSALACIAMRLHGRDYPDLFTAVSLTQPSNAFTISGLTVVDAPPPAFSAAAITGLLTYPNNANLNYVESQIHLASDNYEVGQKYAEAAIRSAPNDIFTWVDLSYVMLLKAGAVRKGRNLSDMSPSDIEVVARLYAKCEALSQRAVHIDPNCGAAWEALAVASTYGNNPHEATEAIAKSVALDFQGYFRLHSIFKTYESRGAGDANDLLQYDYAVDLSPDPDPTQRIASITDLCAQGVDIMNYRDLIDRLLVIIPSQLGGALDNNKRYAYALASAKLAPNHAATWRLLGSVVGDYVEALRRYRQTSIICSGEENVISAGSMLTFFASAMAAHLEPDSGDAQESLEEHGMELGLDDTEDVTYPAVWQALKLEPQNFRAFFIALNVFQPKWSHGHHDDLVKVVQQCQANGELFERLSPAIVDALNADGATDGTTQSLLAAAQGALAALIASNTQDPEALISLEVYYARRKDSAYQLKIYLTLLKTSPTNDRVQREYAEYLMDAGQYDAAAAQLRLTIKAFPDDIESSYWLGRILYYQSKFSDAEQQFHSVVAFDPYWSSAYYYLGATLDAEDKKTEAENALQNAIDQDQEGVDGAKDASALLSKLKGS